MEVNPCYFEMYRNSMLPILTVTGKAKNLYGMESFLLNKTVEIIEFAEKNLGGKIIELMGHEYDIGLQKGMIAVRFYLLFETEEAFSKAIQRMRKELG